LLFPKGRQDGVGKGFVARLLSALQALPL
jgi:hypothetical protein